MALFQRFVAQEHDEGRVKEWKRRLLRKAVLVLSEVAVTGKYEWNLSRRVHANDGIDATLRPVQEQFEAWLGAQQLAAATASLYATVSRTVLAWLPERGVIDVQGLSGADVSAAVVFLGERYRPGSMRTVLTAMRVLTRFLEDVLGCGGLSRAIARSSSKRVGVVRVLPADRIDELTRTSSANTPVGLRNRALLLLAARTGLRPVDLVGLRLRDIDWRQARIALVQHKTGQLLTVPLLADVGDAIADYLLHGRPAGADSEHVFLRAQAPFTALSPSNGLHHVAATAFARTRDGAPAGTGRGFRVLRASLATRMLEDGAPLPVIAGVLGHRSIDSAKHYLAADEQHMRNCCLDFVGIDPRRARL
ncbi:MAG: tyrosine-type recombinase/integrase [Cellulomonadaceae bacterium]